MSNRDFCLYSGYNFSYRESTFVAISTAANYKCLMHAVYK